MVRKKPGVEPIGAGLLPQGNDGIICQLRQLHRLPGQAGQSRAHHGHLVNFHQGDGTKGLGNGRRGCDHCQVRHPRLHIPDGGGGGIVHQLDMNAGIAAAEHLQHRQQHGMQGNLCGGDTQNAPVQALTLGNFLLCGIQLLHCHRHMAVQRLPLGGEVHLSVGPEKQGAAQLPLQIPNGAGDIGLAVQQGIRRLGKALEFGNMVKNAVIFVVDIHQQLHIRMIYIHGKTIFYLSFPLDYNDQPKRSQHEWRK